ncbi:MAG TPA: 16S rRNA (guanine(527)-N(7))-methyltransferase RsmG [Dehalococcoidia bacterium]|nr:16S rRNA (guanine(527)-N(7))-methyltransferase RsmG [Dehalococcoidia bacterium]
MDELRLGLAPDKAALLERYAALIRAENGRAGLVSRGDLEAIERRHLAESIALLDALKARALLKGPAIDVGSGAGFPGVPFAALRPGLQVTLLEASQKKAAFLHRVIEELGLDDADVVALRAEEAGRDPAHREKYSLTLARAVAPLPILLEYALPLLAVGGTLAAPKGSAAPREVSEADNALRELGAELVEVVPLPIDAGGPIPTLILVRKTAATADRYPRRTGIARKRPL